ncbi:hypothetical protein G3I18_30535 [Actinospica acidiphila]|uniref:DUF7716 domain-containing protein n=1 Tax=Actinospica acidiphila TaxID=304899 RepID=A0A9X5CQN1_9ACTN|nr:hypothetical protein [Actinospica acidiphila]NEC52855.1 hypothetical protein [Actinospica acidiphila]
MTWEGVLADVPQFRRELPHVFFQRCPTRGYEPCLAVDEDEFEPNEDVPAVARSRGFTHGLPADDVFQVMENLRQQDPHADRDVLLRAITHSFEWDAFIDLSEI